MEKSKIMMQGKEMKKKRMTIMIMKSRKNSEKRIIKKETKMIMQIMGMLREKTTKMTKRMRRTS